MLIYYLLKKQTVMVNNIIGCNMLWSRRRRLLFLLFLALFAISSIADPYTDSLFSSPGNFNGQNNSNYLIANNDLDDDYDPCLLSIHAAEHYYESLHHSSEIDSPECIIKKEFPLLALISSQTCPPLSSDPSPPVA